MAGDYEEKSLVCRDCTRCKGKPPLLTESTSPEAITKRIVSRIETLVHQINSGQPFDWNDLEYLDWQLLTIWRSAEGDFERQLKIQSSRIFEAMMTSR